MKAFLAATLAVAFLFPGSSSTPTQSSNGSTDATPSNAAPITGFRDPSAEHALETRFLAVPDPKIAEADLRVLTQAPHMAGTPEDKATADYVAKKFREAGLETSISEYRVWMNYPAEMKVTVTAPAGVKMQGPTPEHVAGDLYENNPRIVMPFNSMSPSGDVEADVVYADYGRPEDFKKLEEMKIDVRGKIVICRYGQNFRGVKVLDAQEHGAAGVIIYSDPYDDGWRRGDSYPKGPWRPQSGVQRGSAGFMFKFPGDPTTPGIASVPSLPESKRTPPSESEALPKIPSIPISYGDAWPILANLGGEDTPRDWQGALPFTYHVGPGPVRVKMHVKQNYQYRTIWDVIGRIPGSEFPDQTVIAGNHRDAWVFGAADPGSGTAAMLETVRGVGELLKSGWKPKRTIIFASWDGEEEGLIGSTEWAEDHAAELDQAVAYFNTDVAVSGPKFEASAVPSLKDFVRDIAKSVPSPAGGTVFDQWTKPQVTLNEIAANTQEAGGSQSHPPAAQENAPEKKRAPVGDLGSGSDYTVFLQHLGIPSTDIGSTGSYGVYHSAFDDFQWFKEFGDPNFLYEQQMAQLFGLETLRMANADVLPYDYRAYGEEVISYLAQAQKKADSRFGAQSPSFASVEDAAHRFEKAGEQMWSRQHNQATDVASVDQSLKQVERALLLAKGLPGRPFYRHAIYAPGMYTGYAAVTIPGVNEAIEQHDLGELDRQLSSLTGALNAAAQILESK